MQLLKSCAPSVSNRMEVLITKTKEKILTDATRYDIHMISTENGASEHSTNINKLISNTPFLTQKVDEAQVLKYGMPQSAVK